MRSVVWRLGLAAAVVALCLVGSVCRGDGCALAWSTFVGGSDMDRAQGVAVDGSGSVYVTGYTYSADFPTTAGAYDTTYNGGGYDVFVTKLNSTGSALLYSTYLGGSGNDGADGIAVDTSGSAYVTGGTSSADDAVAPFPTTSGAFDRSFNGGTYDVFVSKLNPAGSSLSYSTFLGGSSNEGGSGIAVDTSGSAYVTGGTVSSDFPTTAGAFDTSINGSADAFVAKLSSNGRALTYCTYLGGSSADAGYGIAVDGSGAAYILGGTSSSGFPTTAGAFDTSYNGGDWDVFVSKLNSTGSAQSL
jgi:hypothetical protein